MNPESNSGDDKPRDILIPKDQVRKISDDKVEILGEEGASASRNPFDGTPFAFKNVRMISSGPLVFLLPILLPLIFLLMLVLIVPLMLFGRFFVRRSQ